MPKIEVLVHEVCLGTAWYVADEINFLEEMVVVEDEALGSVFYSFDDILNWRVVG